MMSGFRLSTMQRAGIVGRPLAHRSGKKPDATHSDSWPDVLLIGIYRQAPELPYAEAEATTLGGSTHRAGLRASSGIERVAEGDLAGGLPDVCVQNVSTSYARTWSY